MGFSHPLFCHAWSYIDQFRLPKTNGEDDLVYLLCCFTKRPPKHWKGEGTDISYTPGRSSYRPELRIQHTLTL